MMKTLRVVAVSLLACCASFADGGVADTYTIMQGEILFADGLDGNPQGVRANDTGGVDLVPGELEGPGILEMRTDGTFIYTPPAQFFGEATFTYRLTEGEPTTLIADDAEWRFLAQLQDPAGSDPDFHDTWMMPDFDDDEWRSGTRFFANRAFSNRIPNTTLPVFNARAVYFRHEFDASGEFGELILNLIRDDAAIIYLNGVEVGRSRAFFSAFDQQADGFALPEPIPPALGSPEPVLEELAGATVEGTNVLAISLHNALSTGRVECGFQVESLTGTATPSRTEVDVTVTVADANVPPVIEDDRYLVTGDGVFDSTQAFSLYENDGVLSPTGVAYDPITEVVVEGDAAAQVNVDLATGHFTFSPEAGFGSSTSFSYRLRDKDGLSEPATVALTAFPGIPDLPVANPDSYSWADRQGSFLRGELLANDLNATRTALVREAENGSASVGSTGEFSYRPHPNFIGTDTFEYAAEQVPVFDLIAESSSWRWMNPRNGIDPAAREPDFNETWMDREYDSSAWLPGFGLMGYGNISGSSGIDTDIGLPLQSNRRTAYFRTVFSGVAGEHDLHLRMSRDDAAIIYVNGEEVLRTAESQGFGWLQDRPDWYATMTGIGDGYWTDDISEGTMRNLNLGARGVTLKDGANVLAISVHNTGNQFIAISTDLGLKVESLELRQSLLSPATTVTVEVPDEFEVPELEGDSYVVMVGDVLHGSGAASLFANDSLFDHEGIAFDPITNVTTTPPMIGQLQTFDSATGEFTYLATEPGIDYFTYQVEDKDGVSELAEVRIEVRDREDLWRLRHFDPEDGPEISGSLADPDCDGMINRVEYALGFDPNVSDVDPGAFPVTAEIIHEDWIDWSVIVETPLPVPSDLKYVLEVSRDMTDWSDEASLVGGVEDAKWEARTIGGVPVSRARNTSSEGRLSGEMYGLAQRNGEGSLFCRLRIEEALPAEE